MSRTAYLGPPGTFSQRAAEALAAGDELIPLLTPAEVIAAVANGDTDAGVVPFENSVEGEIAASLDALAGVAPAVLIVAEHIIEVTFNLFRLPGDDTPLRTVLSHPAALTQCSRFLRHTGVTTEVSPSTAAACNDVAEAAIPARAPWRRPAQGSPTGSFRYRTSSRTTWGHAPVS